jgi:hypothetical protein
MNVLLSSLIKRRWPERAGFLIGLYITALSAGAIVASLVSVPLWQASGGSLALTLGWLAAPAALGALLWLPQLSPGGTVLKHGGLPPPVPPGPRTPRGPRAAARWQKPPSYRAAALRQDPRVSVAKPDKNP